MSRLFKTGDKSQSIPVNEGISRDNIQEVLNFLSDKGYLELKETTKDLDDLLDEFENLPEY